MKDESVVGWYVNPLPDDSEWLLFTERALYVVRAHEVHRFAYDGIVSYERPASKADADSVVIATPAATQRYGRFCDAWLFVRIVHALV